MQNSCFPNAPGEWKCGFVQALANINPRYALIKGKVYPFIEMASVAENFGGINELGTRKLEGSGLTRFKTGDTLFAKITPCPENGKVAFVPEMLGSFGLGSTEFIVLSPRNNCNPRFLFHLLCADAVRGRATARMEGSTGRQRVPDDVFNRRLIVSAPLPEEQTAIARILDAVDIAMDHLRETLDRATLLRLGLLQSAFAFEWTDEPMKETDVGQIPQSWDAIKGKQAFNVIASGNSSIDALKHSQGLAIDAWFMKVDDFNLPENQRVILRTKVGFSATENKGFRTLPIGTVVIAKRGAAILKNRVRTTVVPIALDPNLMGLQMLPGLRSEFFKYQLEWRNLARYVESSGIPQLNNKDLYPRWFLRAPDEHQRQIIQVISAAEARQDALSAQIIALEQLKKSLLHDLLTGIVRVRPEQLSAILPP